MDDTIVPNVSSDSKPIGCNSGDFNPGEFCFVCKVAFDRNLKKSRRRILRDRDDLVSPLLLLLWTAQRTGAWFSKHSMHLTGGPLDHSVTQHLQSMFACRKCFEKVIKLERDVINFETEISTILDQSCDSLLQLDIIRGDPQTVTQLQTQFQLKQENKTKKVRKIKTKKKIKVLPKKKKKVVTQGITSVAQPQQHIQKTKQILLLTKGEEGDQQQLLVLQVPANDNDTDDNESCHQITAYNPSLDHQYHNDENQAVFLSSNAIPVTTCVTVSSDDQVLEVQLATNKDRDSNDMEEGRASDGEQEMIDETDNQMRTEDETSEAVSTIPAEEKDWNLYTDGFVISNQYHTKRKIDSNEESEDPTLKSEDEMDVAVRRRAKKAKECYNKRTYSPRSSSPLPPAGESKVVVQLLYGSKQWKRTMDGDIKSIIRDMALRRPEPAGRKIAASDKLCSAVMKNYSKRLVAECKDAARTIRVSDHQDVTQLDMKTFTAQVFQKCPKTANLVKSLIPVEPRDTLDEHGATALIMGIILYMHSMQSNTLQHILSYVLRRAGCNREGFKTLHSLGLTLSYTSILKLMNDIDAKPDIEKSSLDTIEKSIDSVVIRTKNESKADTKKKCAQIIAQESTQEGDPVLLQFTLPYYPNSSHTTYAAIPLETNDSTVYTSQ